MQRRDIMRQFYDELNREEEQLSVETRSDRLGLLMRTVVNELDLVSESGLHPDGSRRCSDEDFTILRLGTLRIVKMAMETHNEFDAPTLTYQRDERLSRPASELMRRAGTIEHGRRIAQSLFAFGGTIEKEDRTFDITLPAVLPNLGAHERDLHLFHQAEKRTAFLEMMSVINDSDMHNRVNAKLSELVYPFRDKFIGYDADPLLDDAFFGLAYHEMLIAQGYDTFHYATRFGNSTFQNIKLAATFIMSIAMRHRAFVTALIAKHPAIRREDVLTVSVKTDSFVEGLEEFVNHYGALLKDHVPITPEGAREIFDTISLHRGNLELLDRPGAPLPPLIQCSETHVIRPLAAARADELMIFVLNALRAKYPRDYDRAQQAGEGVMQRAISAGLRHILPDLEFRTNVKLRRKRKISTDVDLVVFSEDKKRLLLVQLKHQDPYGMDLSSMLSRTRRLNEQVSRWIDRTKRWIAEVGADELRATFRLPKSTENLAISYLVIARHYAHSLRDLAEVEGFTFANWPQIITAIDQHGKEKDQRSLAEVLKKIERLSAADPELYLPEPPSEWAVGDLRYVVNGNDDLGGVHGNKEDSAALQPTNPANSAST